MTAHINVSNSGKQVHVLCAACALDEDHGRNYPEAVEAAGRHNETAHASVG
jgi:hypothetical protein